MCHGSVLGDFLLCTTIPLPKGNTNKTIYEKDEVGVWKAWRKRFCVNKLLPTNTLNGNTGINNVLFEFTEYYKDVAKPHMLLLKQQ